jgi:hypothetical protein
MIAGPGVNPSVGVGAAVAMAVGVKAASGVGTGEGVAAKAAGDGSGVEVGAGEGSLLHAASRSSVEIRNAITLTLAPRPGKLGNIQIAPSA